MFVPIGVDVMTLKRPHVVSIVGLAVLTLAFLKNGLIESMSVRREAE